MILDVILVAEYFSEDAACDAMRRGALRTAMPFATRDTVCDTMRCAPNRDAFRYARHRL